jgi:hypothetical protein
MSRPLAGLLVMGGVSFLAGLPWFRIPEIEVPLWVCVLAGAWILRDILLWGHREWQIWTGHRARMIRLERWARTRSEDGGPR